MRFRYCVLALVTKGHKQVPITFPKQRCILLFHKCLRLANRIKMSSRTQNTELNLHVKTAGRVTIHKALFTSSVQGRLQQHKNRIPRKSRLHLFLKSSKALRPEDPHITPQHSERLDVKMKESAFTSVQQWLAVVYGFSSPVQLLCMRKFLVDKCILTAVQLCVGLFVVCAMPFLISLVEMRLIVHYLVK